jgi:hypothetical protein
MSKELIKHERLDEYGDTYTTYSGKKLDYLISIAEEMNEKCENKNYNSPDKKFVKWDESCLRLDDKIWHDFRNYCAILYYSWDGNDYELCDTCKSIIEEKVRKVYYPTQDEIHENLNDKIKILHEKIITITTNMKELHEKMDKILEHLTLKN